MENKSQTLVAQLFFLGFRELGWFQNLLFILILTAYTMTVAFNILIITLVSTRQRLNFPMYFLLKNFLGSEMFSVTIVIPNLLSMLWFGGAAMSIPGCIAQSYFCGVTGSTECYLLAAMPYDRYLAICKPLYYNVIMDLSLQYFLVIFCWLMSFLLTFITLSFLVQLTFCGSNIIDHYYCDLSPLLDLACSDISAFQVEIFILSVPLSFCSGLCALVCPQATPAMHLASLLGQNRFLGHVIMLDCMHSPGPGSQVAC
uniref:G-protein coupled receptors family 1 profile domain-containing protein n=1 Tax=Pyxicephalus adspersus TaxID=30357 RepID=A0AAV3AQK5_PYXAD|nr:TPA: hypothetical protein GDO54_005869 [Pyxicephalus adspersus]